MKTYIALLRGINVSGQKKIKMADLRQMLQNLNFEEVETYIQSGNIVLKSEIAESQILGQKIKEAIANNFGFDVPILVKTYEGLKSIFEKNPFTEPSDIENGSVFFVLLKETPQDDLLEDFRKEEFVNEQFEATDDCIYLACRNGYGNAKLNNNLIERRLKVSATTRNYKTMVKLLEMAEGQIPKTNSKF